MCRGLILGCILLLTFTGCNNTVINRGYDFASANFSQVVVGKDKIDSVFQKLGSPTLRSTVLQPNGDFYWYYTTKQITQSGVVLSKIKYRKIYCVKFDRYGTVQKVYLIDKENKLKSTTETTKARGKSKGVFKELFSGMGKNLERYSK